MDVTFDRAALVRELAVMERVVDKKVTIPVLSAVLMQADGDAVHMAATNIDLSMRGLVSAQVAEEGSAALPARKLYELAKSLSTPSIRIATAADGATVTAAGFKARLQTHNADDFPTIAAPERSEQSFVVAGASLRGLVMRTRFAVTESDKRYFMAGALLEIGPDYVRMVSTDAHRLAKADAPLKNGPAEPASVIVPKRALDTLASMLEEYADEDVVFSASGNHLFFGVGERLLITRKVDGEFPAYHRVIPKSFSTSAVIERAALATALRRASLIADANSRRVDLELNAERLLISATSVDVGEGSEELPASDYRGNGALAFSINGGYIADFAEVVATEKIEVRLNDPQKVAGWYSVGGDIAYEYVVSPVMR